MGQKKSLFRFVYDHTREEGFFLDIDAVKTPSNKLEEWYLELWREGIVEKETEIEISESFIYTRSV